MTKQEQIEEMIKLIDNVKPFYVETIAEALYNAGYRKVLLDTEYGKAVNVVQYAPWKLIDEHTEREVGKARKETAKEILDMLYDMGIDKEILGCCRTYDVNGVSLAKQICEKYGVEIGK